MRKTCAVVLMLAVAVAAIPAKLYAAVKGGGQQSGSINGVARDANKATLPNYTVNVRNATTGALVNSTTSSQTGTFTFAALEPGNYMVEIVDATGRVVGLSSSVGVAAGSSVAVTVTASTAGAIATATGGGFGLLGLGTAASVAVIGAAGAATALVAVQATTNNASPSK
jgi:hypothetical protein